MRLATVILRHEVPSEGTHFDWMFAVNEPATEPLRTWRLVERADLAPIGATIPVEPLAGHRSTYLTYEGPISGGRGEVTRVCTGWWTTEEVAHGSDDSFEFSVEWANGSATQRWVIVGREARRLG